jgi:hypothetical protein
MDVRECVFIPGLLLLPQAITASWRIRGNISSTKSLLIGRHKEPRSLFVTFIFVVFRHIRQSAVGIWGVKLSELQETVSRSQHT